MKYLPVTVLLSVSLLLAPGVMACKDIIATGDATAGDYNLLLKVRDPSRPGPQVLCMVNRSYAYDYHTPWTGSDMHFITQHKFIGVATKGDVPPNIVKMGMALSDAGIVYADADVPSYKINPTRNAWDDFDWMRYACQNASSEEEAIDLLIEVVAMHAPGVAENLFVVGPQKAYVMEANAINYAVTSVSGIAVMSNYPNELWGRYFLRRAFVASSFDKTFEGEVRKGRTIRLGSMMGIKVLDVGSDGVVVKQAPFGGRAEIKKGEGKTVGFFRVDVLDCTDRKVKLHICYEYFAWENEMMKRAQAEYGSITPGDMMNLSRLRSGDIGGMRGMCEGENEAAMVFKIPRSSASMSMGWFAPDQCSSIFVPVHIIDTNILPAYESGEAADVAVELLEKFGRGNITDDCKKVECIFMKENDRMEGLACLTENAGKMLTASDMGMQQQAILMQKIFLTADSDDKDIAAGVWNISYRRTLRNIKEDIGKIGDNNVKGKLASVALSIVGARAEMAKTAGNDNAAIEEYEKGKQMVENGEYIDGLNCLLKAYDRADSMLFGIHESGITTEEKRNDYAAVIFGIIIAGALLLFVIRRRL